jgi:hypothetical protein
MNRVIDTLIRAKRIWIKFNFVYGREIVYQINASKYRIGLVPKRDKISKRILNNRETFR